MQFGQVLIHINPSGLICFLQMDIKTMPCQMTAVVGPGPGWD
jgi:hypothetical protein